MNPVTREMEIYGWSYDIFSKMYVHKRTGTRLTIVEATALQQKGQIEAVTDKANEEYDQRVRKNRRKH